MSTQSQAQSSNAAQAIAFALRDFVNSRTPVNDASNTEFLNRIGGISTLFALIVAIQDPTHHSLLRKSLVKIFDTSLESARHLLLSPQVIQTLLSGISQHSPKHVRLITIDQANQLMTFKEGINRVLQPDLLLPLLSLLRDEDVEITEEMRVLVSKIGATYEGMKRLFETETLDFLFQLTIDRTDQHDESSNNEKKSNSDYVVIDKTNDNESITEPFIQLFRSHAASSSPSVAPPLNSIVLLRVLTLLTHIACGTSPNQQQGGLPKVFIDPSHPLEEIRNSAWSLYRSRGLFRVLLEIASIAPNLPNHDMLVQLNGLELLEEVVLHCPQLNESFAVELTRDLLDRAVKQMQELIDANAASSSSKSHENRLVSTVPASSFITVAVLRVFNKLASVSSLRHTHSWYHESSFLLFLSSCFNNYDDESVQTEAIDLVATLSTFTEGLTFFSTFTSSLPSTVAPSQTAAYLSNPYADAITPVLLYQLAFFVYGSTYSSGLRQLASLHGMAKIFRSIPDDSTTQVSSASSNSSILSTLANYIQKYNPNKSTSLEILLLLARQPFEDLREAVWSTVRGMVNHEWGIAMIASTGGFLEYLLDRRTEIHISGSQAKYDILRTLGSSPASSRLLSEANMKQVREYVTQGVHYTPRQVHVKGPVDQTSDD